MPAPSDLSADQAKAINDIRLAVQRKPVSTFVGPAGSGKTTLMQVIVDEQSASREVTLLCPTGKAASVLTAKTGRQAQTIHRALYGRAKEHGGSLHFTDPRPPCQPGGLVVCDEASMVGVKLGEDLERQVAKVRGKILYVGDKEQLPPVNESWAADFANPDAELTEVHRQARGSAILSLATAIRTRRPFDGWRDDCAMSDADPVAWLVDRIRADIDATLICYTNATRHAANNLIREALGRRHAIERGDLIVCRTNNAQAGMFNGELARVTWARQGLNDCIEVRLDNGTLTQVHPAVLSGVLAYQQFTRNMNRRHRDNYLHAEYGYCLTAHSSQGSQWEEVGFMREPAFGALKQREPDTARRLAYTAVTRAAKRLLLFSMV